MRTSIYIYTECENVTNVNGSVYFYYSTLFSCFWFIFVFLWFCWVFFVFFFFGFSEHHPRKFKQNLAIEIWEQFSQTHQRKNIDIIKIPEVKTHHKINGMCKMNSKFDSANIKKWKMLNKLTIFKQEWLNCVSKCNFNHELYQKPNFYSLLITWNIWTTRSSSENVLDVDGRNKWKTM